MKKKILAALLASAMVLSVAGCEESSSSDDSDNTTSGSTTTAGDADDSSDSAETTAGEEDGDSTDGDKLTILTWSGTDIPAMVKLFIENTDYTEDDITYIETASNGEGARDAYDDYLESDNDADIICMDADWVKLYVEDDKYTEGLSEIGITESDYSNAYQYTVDIGTDANGVLKAASFQAAAGGYVYRADLAEQYLGVTSPEEMQELVKDWDTFKETAAKVYEASGGTTTMVASEGDLWQVYAMNRTSAWVDADNNLVIGEADGFFDFIKEFADAGYVSKDIDQWGDGWYTQGVDGTTMGYFFCTWCLTNASTGQLYQAEGGPKEDTWGQYRLVIGPQSYYWGGTWMAPTTKCNSNQIAADFIKFFTVDTDTMQLYAESTGDFANNKVAMQNIIDAGTNQNEMLGGQDQFAILAEGAAQIDMSGMATKYDSAIKGYLNEAAQGYMRGTYSTKEEAIEAFKQDVASNIADITVS